MGFLIWEHMAPIWKRSEVTALVDKNEIDAYCIYCPQADECYYIDPKRFDKSKKERELQG